MGRDQVERTHVDCHARIRWGYVYHIPIPILRGTNTMAARIGFVDRIYTKKKTSIGSNPNRSRPTNKAKKRMTKPYRGQG